MRQRLSLLYPAGYAVDAVIILNLRQVENRRINGSSDWGWAFSMLAVVGYTGTRRFLRQGARPISG